MTAAELMCWHCRRAPAEKRHVPCCSAHGKPLCCTCYCRLHFVEVNPCSSSERHAEQEAAS
jgi:hypothetical protein